MNKLPSDVTGRSGDEVEVTPEMIDAGALALSEYDRELESLEEGATRIFLAMRKAAPCRRCSV